MLETNKLFAAGALFFVVLAGALMQASTLRIYGIAPNLVLVCLVVASFFTENSMLYALIVLFGSWSVRATPTLFDELAVTTTVLALAVFWLQRRIVVRGLVGVSLLIGITTLGMYAIIQPSFIWLYPVIFAGELIYNICIGFILFEFADRLIGRRVRI